MRVYNERYSCEELIKDVFVPDLPMSVMELPEHGFEITIDADEDGHWYILNSDYEDVILVFDPENLNTKY